MKQRANVIIFFVLCLTLSSCFEDKRPQSYLNEFNTEQADTLTNKKSEADTLNKDSIPTVQDDSLNISQQESQITDQLSFATREDDSPNFWEILSLCVGGLALVLCVVIWYLMTQVEKELIHIVNKLEHDLNKQRQDANRKNEEHKKNNEDKYSNIQIDLDRMSERIKKLELSPKDSTIHEERNVLEQQNDSNIQSLKRGFFGIVKVGGGISMFNDYPKSRNEAYFEVDYLDDSRCEFVPIDLDRIRSIDAVGEAVEYNGDMAYAKSMKVRKKGKAVLDKEHGFWKISEKAYIELKN